MMDVCEVIRGSKMGYSQKMKIADFDPELWAAIQGETRRQEDHLELIASENYASPRVLEAQGSVLTNKYAEGYPGKRYYGGCEYVDVAEQLAIDRAKVNFSGKLFRAAQYGIRPDSGEIDYQQVQRLAEEHRPKMIIAGFSAYSRIID